MHQILPFAPTLRLCDVPGLADEQLIDLAKTLPLRDLRRLWEVFGDEEQDLAPADWRLPRLIGGVDLHAIILRRLHPALYADPQFDLAQPKTVPPVSFALPKTPDRVDDYAARRAAAGDTADARANGCLGLTIFSPLDMKAGDLCEDFERPVHRLRNGSTVAGELRLHDNRETLTGWTVESELAYWREHIKPLHYPHLCSPPKSGGKEARERA